MFKVVSDYAYSTLFELIHLRIFLKCAKADEGWLASEVCKYCAVRDNIRSIISHDTGLVIVCNCHTCSHTFQMAVCRLNVSR
jgi:hypothetical protein